MPTRSLFKTWLKSAFRVRCLCNKQNNTWLLGDMEFLFSCSTRYLKWNTRRDIPYLGASMYYSLFNVHLIVCKPGHEWSEYCDLLNTNLPFSPPACWDLLTCSVYFSTFFFFGPERRQRREVTQVYMTLQLMSPLSGWSITFLSYSFYYH